MISPAMRLEIRGLAAAHVAELGIVSPPFDHLASLEYRQMELLREPLEAVLADSSLPPEAQEKIDGFVDLRSRVICLRGGLHPHRYRLGLLHELAHDAIPWQKELLHYCPIFTLPLELQRDFEREANVFAVECSFLADRFTDLVADRPDHLGTAVELAEAHGMSFEATFRHYVECHQGRCLLVVSRLVSTDLGSGIPTFQVQYYVPSPNAGRSVQIRARFAAPELARLLVGYDRGAVDHLVDFGGSSEGPLAAQSFWNTYQLFTLVWL